MEAKQKARCESFRVLACTDEPGERLFMTFLHFLFWSSADFFFFSFLFFYHNKESIFFTFLTLTFAFISFFLFFLFLIFCTFFPFLLATKINFVDFLRASRLSMFSTENNFFPFNKNREKTFFFVLFDYFSSWFTANSSPEAKSTCLKRQRFSLTTLWLYYVLCLENYTLLLPAFFLLSFFFDFIFVSHDSALRCVKIFFLSSKAETEHASGETARYVAA